MGVELLQLADVSPNAVCDLNSAGLVDVDISIDEVGAGTGVQLCGRPLALKIAEHPLPSSLTGWTGSFSTRRKTQPGQTEQQQGKDHLLRLAPHI